MKSNLFIWNSQEVHMNVVWNPNELLLNFIWNEIKFIYMNLHAVRMKFIWTSYRRTNEVYMLYPCNNNEDDIRLMNSSLEIHMKFICISNDLNFMWTSSELHDIYTRSSYVLYVNMVSGILAMYFIWMSPQVHRTIHHFILGVNAIKGHRTVLFWTFLIPRYKIQCLQHIYFCTSSRSLCEFL